MKTNFAMRFSASGRSIVSKRLKQDSFQGEQFVPMFSGRPERERKKSQREDTQADAEEGTEEGVAHDMRILHCVI